jgi:hypothetical protein
VNDEENEEMQIMNVLPKQSVKEMEVEDDEFP